MYIPGKYPINICSYFTDLMFTRLKLFNYFRNYVANEQVEAGNGGRGCSLHVKYCVFYFFDVVVVVLLNTA